MAAMNALASETKQMTAPGAYSIDLSRYDFIDSSLNVIQYPKGNASFTPFFNKLDTLVFENKGQVRILHVGGSHLQAARNIREHPPVAVLFSPTLPLAPTRPPAMPATTRVSGT